MFASALGLAQRLLAAREILRLAIANICLRFGLCRNARAAALALSNCRCNSSNRFASLHSSLMIRVSKFIHVPPKIAGESISNEADAPAAKRSIF
jgi:hypothetical protein